MKVQLTVHKDHLVVSVVDPDKPHPDFTPAGDGRIGCVLTRPGRNLGASKEAIAWLKERRPTRDAIGEVMANEQMFGWMGGSRCVIPPGIEGGDRDYRPDQLEYVEIQNDVPDGARQHIDSSTRERGRGRDA